jgi:hypothetical protein
MEVLQRLEKEAREARERRSAEAGARQEHEAAAGSRLAPALERAATYLDSVASNLSDLDRIIQARYSLGEAGVLEGLRQSSYRSTRRDEGDGAVQLRFACTAPNPLEATIDGHPQAEALARELRDAGLVCNLRPLSERTMRLRVDAKVPVRVSFVPDPERVCIRLELHNLTALGVERYLFEPERVDAKLLDAVTSMVLREPSDFAALTGSVIDDGKRAELQRRLARDGRQRDAEVSGGLRRLLFPVAEWFRRHFLGG